MVVRFVYEGIENELTCAIRAHILENGMNWKRCKETNDEETKKNRIRSNNMKYLERSYNDRDILSLDSHIQKKKPNEMIE